ncbi:MAG: ISAs1 family transposase [Chlorobi bacterium]|nr:ISAs1 family transposase [Chlorobiota bacterium]
MQKLTLFWRSKENHKTLFEELTTDLDAVIDENFSTDKCDTFETTEKGHGRIETRRDWITEDIDGLSGKDKWTDLISIGVLESHRHVISTNTTTIERRYYMASIKAKAMLFASTVRGHWGVEIGFWM